MKEVYVVRSAEFKLVYYAAVPTLEDAKEVIAYLQSHDEEQDVYGLFYDYDRVQGFDDARSAIEFLREEYP